MSGPRVSWERRLADPSDLKCDDCGTSAVNKEGRAWFCRLCGFTRCARCFFFRGLVPHGDGTGRARACSTRKRVDADG